MHLIFPRAIEVDPNDCEGHKFKAYSLRFLSPPNRATCRTRRYLFSLYYTVAQVFPIMNTLIYWGCLVPSGHGGFAPPRLPHGPQHPPFGNNETLEYYPDKGLFDQDPIKAFSIINVWSITSVVAFIEVFFLNSIRRPTSVVGHAAGVMFCSGAYLLWAEIGKLATGHSGLFFLDPDIIKDMPQAIIAAGVAFIAMSPGVFTYVYGLIAMRETITAVRHDSSY
ncbi:uncharacterized protein F4812DRAFT_405236 [Daldinia caldariorum]|uniref:uncharacterized protein n=1 Tax=Daldinia caldariorum TaxID=326644 RepID=UPI002007F91E|nr:uncharacterized protein F4812DRAFT_405236 [Daldinia caldariorum]KAI1467690.1 hypothetical protein F4812DRAFT_405236 [Daldinia caldariorum]